MQIKRHGSTPKSIRAANVPLKQLGWMFIPELASAHEEAEAALTALQAGLGKIGLTWNEFRQHQVTTDFTRKNIGFVLGDKPDDTDLNYLKAAVKLLEGMQPVRPAVLAEEPTPDPEPDAPLTVASEYRSQQATVKTFGELVLLEPRLAHLEHEIHALAAEVKRRKRFCALQCWYGYGADSRCLKDRMLRLVGYMRPKHSGEDQVTTEIMTSTIAYDVCYDHLFGLLPNCKRCGCAK